MTLKIIPATCLVAALFVVPPAPAAERDRDEPIRINARTVEADDRTGAVVYSGNVQVVQGRLSIRAERVEIRTRDGRTDQVRATGKPVTLRQRGDADSAEIQAEAERVVYQVAQKKIELTGRVSLQRGDDRFTADVLRYDLDTRSLTAAGDENSDGRVHAVIQPRTPADPASRSLE